MLFFNYSVGFSKPSITQFGQSAVVDEPSKLTESCEARGFPVPKITWLQNGAQMPLCLKDESNRCVGQNYQVREYSSDENAFSRSTLVVVHTGYPRDQGKYTCLASNSEGTVKMTMNVSVHSKYNAQSVVLCYGAHNFTHYLYHDVHMPYGRVSYMYMYTACTPPSQKF